jgi:phenylacetate-CoA ligase
MWQELRTVTRILREQRRLSAFTREQLEADKLRRFHEFVQQPVPNISGSRYLSIRNLVGRTEIVPTFTNDDGVDDFVSPHTINEIFVAGVTRFQLQMTSANSFAFPACLDPALDASARSQAVAALEARLRAILVQKRMGSVRFAIEIRDEIAPDPHTRKFRLIVDRRGETPSTKDSGALEGLRSAGV